MNTIRFMVAFAILQILCIGSAKAQTNLLDGMKWSKTSLSTNQPSGGFQKGGVQGAAILNGVMYQFRGAGSGNNYVPTYDKYNINAGTWTSGGSLTNLTSSHCGSANFGTNVFTSYTLNETNYTCTIPFVYITNGNTIQIYDIENNVLVATWTLPTLEDDAIAAFDFANGKLWSIGYVSGSRKAPYLVREITGLDFTAVPTDKTFTDSDISKTEVGHSTDSYNDLQNGTIQDAQFVDGKIYFCTGGGSSYHRTEYCRVHVYDTSSNTLIDTKMCVESGESEGFVYDTNTESFLMTTGSTIWKLSAGTGYDTQYNFEPATLVNGYYEIDSASKLLWFKQQVYGGCQDIKAKLTANIDMSGVTDPYSYYVYDINMPTKRVYDATNAFTGEFNGQNYTISNYSITSTPYNNDGLFPYCVGATIKNLTVSGTIKLTTCTNSSGTSGSAVSNVGLIGYMDGGTVTGVDVSGLTIDQTVAGTEGTVNKLIGGRGTNEITESGNITTTYTHDANGHVYKNGFCISDGTCNAPYQTPTLTDGVYQITNAGNLWYFANNLSTLGYGSNAKLTDDINMEGSVHGSFPGIGGYTGSVATEFHGTFDGNGKTISNFYMSSSSRCGLFNSTMGTSDSYATIKNFTITGEMTISGTATQRGSVVGFAEEYTKMEDITSSVNITVSSGSPAQVGGIAGRAGGIMNRCRYNGTLNAGSATTFIGGIAGEEFHYKTGDCIENCLFDGTIKATTNSNLKLGGIGGGTESSTVYNGVIKNCLSKGIICLSGEYSGNLSGIVTGASISKITISDTYYLKDETSTYTISDAIGSGGTGTITGTPIEVTNKDDLTDNQLLYNLQQNAGQADSKGNWIAGTSYPIPGVGDLVSDGGTYYTITFKTDGGTEVASITAAAGTKVAAPDAPTKSGYTFAGWVDASNNAFTFPYTMTAADITLTATWTDVSLYVNGFKTSGSSSDADYYQTPSTTTIDGVTYYQIANAGELWYFSKNISTLGVSANAILTADIDMDETAGDGTKHGSFPGISGYTGIFDGNGKTISNYYQNGGKGIFTTTDGATIKNFTLTGNVYIGDGNAGAIVGIANNKTTIEDVTSSVYLKFTGTGKHVGGIAGRANGIMNRCRFNGKIESTNTGIIQYLGGLAGEAYYSASGATGITNCLFDGEITVKSTNATLQIGGISGGNEAEAPGIINHNFSHGTITIPSGYTGTQSGVVSGMASSNLTTLANYYTVNSSTGTTLAAGIGSSSTDRLYHAPSCVATEVTEAEDLTTGKLLEKLGSANWVYDETLGYPKPLVGGGGTHTHSFDTDGFCVAMDIDAGGYQSVDAAGSDGYYAISNAGQLYDFATKINAGTIALSANAKLTADINMEYVNFPGIGGDKKVYAGTFDGQSHSIINYARVCTGGGSGFFNYASGTVKDFSISGNLFTNKSSSGYFGGVVGNLNNGTIQDVHSSVNITINWGEFGIAGIAGYGNGTINRCRYDGTIATVNYVLSHLSTDIAGICGYTESLTLTNCLFDGKIISYYNGTNSSGNQQIGGIVGRQNNYVLTLKNNLSNGTISLPNLTAEDKTTLVGIVLGNSAAGTLTASTNYYTTVNCTYGSIAFTAPYGTSSTLKPADGTITAVGEAAWSSILLTLNNNVAETDAGERNWTITAGAEYPIPHYSKVEHEHSYDANGYCIVKIGEVNCGAAQPMDGDATNGYTIANAGQLASFRDLVSSSTVGTEINAKLTGNVDLTVWDADDMIGSESKPYCGTFDGQGYTISGVHISPTTSKKHVGLFACVGLNGSGNNNGLRGNTMTVEGNVKNLSVTGSITNTQYYCNQDVDDPLDMGVIGELFDGLVQNVHSSVNLTSTNASRVQVGGVVGGVHIASSENITAKAVIDQCSYGPSCGPTKSAEKLAAGTADTDGIINVNGFDDIAGILGYMQHHVTISNCLYYGHIIQTYDDTKIPSTATKGVTELYTQMGGILGYTTSSGTQGSSVDNNLVLGDFSVPASIAGTTFETENMIYVHQDNGSEKPETPHHNVNAIVGYTGVKDFVTNCYASEHVSISEHTNSLQLNKANSATNITVNVETDDTFDRGMVTAELNLNSKATYDAASDDDKANLTAEPWGQVLGYQMGWNGERNYDKVTPTPSELYSHPGYTVDEPTYKVVKVANSEDNTKYDYTADYYFYDDYGDTTPVPTDGANNTMKVKKIVYTRQSSLIGGYMSLCLPFEFTASMKPDDAVLYEYAGVDGEKVLFNKIDAPIAAGKPFVMHVSTTTAWGQNIENENGTPVALYTGSYDDNETEIKNLPTEVGLYGLFNSKIIGTGYWKMKGDGSCFVKTVGTEDQTTDKAGTSTPISYCYPFRCYLKLPESGSAKVFIPVFVDDETSIDRIKSNPAETTSCFNIMGQRVSNNTKGIVIINGKKYLKK